MRQVKLGNGKVTFGDGKSFVLLAGPCVIESEESVMRHAQKISAIARELKIPYVFKASFDKANRSSVAAFRGPGLRKGLEILQRVKDRFKIPVVSDIHEIDQTGPAGEVLDILQIPAFLCRQTDLLVAAGKTGKVINVKKGQFLAPLDMKNVIDKLESTGNKNILLTERGVSFGYNTLVSDFRSIPIMRQLGYPVVFDSTHSVQRPGGLGNATGGDREFIPTLARCGIVAGCDAIFMEVHENPSQAKSDGPNSLPLKELKPLLQTLKRLHRALRHA